MRRAGFAFRDEAITRQKHATIISPPRRTGSAFPLARLPPPGTLRAVSGHRPAINRHNHNMFSHVVIFWTDPAQPNATEDLLAGANRYLKPIPGVLQFHAGKMVGSHRPVVDQSYQVALNLVFASKQAQDDYQVHPLHVEFLERVFKKVCKKVVVYDFE